MSTAKDSAVPIPARRFVPTLAWALPLVALLALVMWDASARIRRSLDLSSRYGVAVRAPAPDASSPTGYALQRRTLLSPMLAPDALHWVMQTQEMAARGELRIRHVDYDNAPAGRPVHWGAPYRLWLFGLARLDSLALGTPLPMAIERAALWAGPAMLVIALLVVVPLAARRFGPLGAVVIAAGWIGCEPFAVQFAAGNADHHAPVALCAVATVLLLLAGNCGERGRVPWWHVASAVVGAGGMWLSAATMVPVLIGIGIGGLAAAMWNRHAPPTSNPTAWRWWGATGGAATLMAWILEYAPADLGWRLEVIHPLYALAWYGGGEVLCRISRLGKAPRPVIDGGCIAATSIGLLLAALPGVTIMARGAAVFLVSDPFLGSLHADYIAEFQSLARFLDGRSVDLGLLGRLAPAVLFLAAASVLIRRSRTESERLDLAVASGAATAMFALAVVQIRWWGVASGLGLVVVALACRGFAAARARWLAGSIALLCLAPGLLHAVRSAARAGEATESDVRRLAERDLAHRLRLSAGTDPLVIAATPDETTSLIYFSGGRGLGTMYWENIDGLKTSAAILGARTPEAAHALIQQAGVTHVVLFPWDPSDEPCIRLHRGLTPLAPVPRDAFAVALKEGRVPSWLKPLPHRLPDHPLLRDQVVRVFEVTPPESPQRVAVDAAAYLMEMGRAAEAAALEPALARFPDNPAALATLAAMQARRKDARAFGATLQRLLALSGVDGHGLRVEDRLRVALVLAIGGQEDRAAATLRQALAAASERDIRHLSPGSLADMLELTAALRITWPDDALRALAIELTPGAAR